MKVKIIKTLKEYAALIAVVILFFIAPYILRMIDPTTASFDPGILHTIFAVLVMYAIYQAITWSITKTLWPAIGDYMKIGFFNNDFKSLKPLQKVLISLGLYFAILLSFILITIAIL